MGEKRDYTPKKALMIMGFIVIGILIGYYLFKSPSIYNEPAPKEVDDMEPDSQSSTYLSNINWPLNPDITSPKGDSIFPDISGGDLKEIYYFIKNGYLNIKIKLYEPNNHLLRYYIYVNKYESDSKINRMGRFKFLLSPRLIENIPDKESVKGTSTLYYYLPEGEKNEKIIIQEGMMNDPSGILWEMKIDSDEIILAVPISLLEITDKSLIKNYNVDVVVSDTKKDDLSQFQK